jgi:hypothetical protein
MASALGRAEGCSKAALGFEVLPGAVDGGGLESSFGYSFGIVTLDEHRRAELHGLGLKASRFLEIKGEHTHFANGLSHYHGAVAPQHERFGIAQ